MNNYIILDLEWNQGAQQEELSQMPFEIIEIGAVKLDNEKREIGRFSRLIKPQVYRTMHYMNEKIIHIKMQDLEGEQGFPEVYRDFLKWCGHDGDYIFCTWGDLDLTELQKNIRYFDLPAMSDGPIRYLDIQKLYSIAKEDGKIRRTLEYAVNDMDIAKDDSFHRALADAAYTVEVFRRLHDRDVEKRVSFDVFHTPADENREIHVVFDTYSKYISRSFADKTMALNDKEAVSVKCFLCGRNAKKKVDWFTLKGKHYYCLCECREHGMLRAKLRLKKAEDGGVYVVKTVKQVGDEEAQITYLKSKKAHVQHVQHMKNIQNAKHILHEQYDQKSKSSNSE